ncbi:PadR family transcriptional regulator [Demequina muriae]|uniref:PadR family transcriptional regulator n=1 Tax=Demequina muriae TaxID=3051664 RepID=A0ABT8GJA3_9MICO|nr:PadR family transcriptional regulator [Demequina sp. EGI L300058]MDN4481507.1 PadR family transcriptional regulator [Demequina sp. EGI L300058]
MRHENDDTQTWILDSEGHDERHGGPRAGRRRHGRPGPGGGRGGFGPGGPGPGGFGPGGRGRGRGGRPRGDVRMAILVLLAEQPRHGYDLIRAIEERTGGAWAPSPGSIYPTLQALQDEGMVTIEEVEGRRTASLTDAGRDWLAQQDTHEGHVFERARGGADGHQLREEIAALTEAAVHVARRSGTEGAPAKVTAILAEARRDIYRLLTEQE